MTDSIGDDRISPSADTLSLQLSDFVTGQLVYLDIDIRQIKNISKMLHFYRNADIFCYTMNNEALKKYGKINSLENPVRSYSIVKNL